MFLDSSPQTGINIPQQSFLKQQAGIPIKVEDTHTLHPSNSQGFIFPDKDDAQVYKHTSTTFHIHTSFTNVITYVLYPKIFPLIFTPDILLEVLNCSRLLNI